MGIKLKEMEKELKGELEWQEQCSLLISNITLIALATNPLLMDLVLV